MFYGGKSPLKKSPYYRHNEFEDPETSLFNIINFQLHNKRRRVFDQGFSTKGRLVTLSSLACDCVS